MNHRFLSLAAGATLLFAGCHTQRPPTTAFSRELIPISEGIRRASSLTLYEGLPHQKKESELLAKELATKQTVQLHGYPFYLRPLPVDPADVPVLRQLSAAYDSYSRYTGPKTCGGYHPDYCLAWKDGTNTYELLICFGCHEMKICGPTHELMADLPESVAGQFEGILGRYRDQRPSSK